MKNLPAKQQLKAKLLAIRDSSRPNKDIYYPIRYNIAGWHDLSISCKEAVARLADRLPLWMPQSRLNTMNDANTFQHFLRHQMPYTEKTAAAIASFSQKTRLPIVLQDSAQTYRFVLTWRQPQSDT